MDDENKLDADEIADMVLYPIAIPDSGMTL